MISRQHLSFSFFILLLMTFLAAPVAIFSGLAIAPIYAIILVALVVEGLKKNALHVPFNAPIFIVILFSVWALIAIFWAIDRDQALMEWSSTFLVIISSIIVCGMLRHLRKTQLETLTLAITISVPLAILFIAIELFSYGSLFTFFRVHLFGKPFSYFNAETYNRGACFLAVFFWVMVMALSRKIRQNNSSVILWMLAFFVITLAALLKLESLSAKVAFIGGAAAFLLVGFLPRMGIRIVQVLVVSLAIALPIITPKLQPMEYANKGFPTSALHRVFIWNFAGQKAQEKPWTGHGFYSSRNIAGGKEPITIQNLSLPEGSVYLPNHTHNSMMQIWLELGYVGLGLYVLAIVFGLSWIAKETSRSPLQQALMVAMVMSYLGISLLAFNVWQEWWVATGLFAFMLMRMYVDGFIDHAPNTRGGRTLL